LAVLFSQLYRSEREYLLVSDESVITKSGKQTYGLDHLFSGLLSKVVPSIVIFTLSLIDIKERRSYPIRVDRSSTANPRKRQLSRKQKSGQGCEKQRLKVARQHEKVANRRLDFQHKLSRCLLDEYGYLALENLYIQDMMKNQRLAKHISDAPWGGFVRLLTYKGA
jgi:transposase